MIVPRSTTRCLLSWALTLSLAASSLITSGCIGCEKPRNVSAPELPRVKEETTLKGANQLVVYLDSSLSMQGYVAQAGSETTFSRTLQELRNFITLVNPPLDVLVRRVDTGVGEPLNNTVLSRASMDQSLFNGVDTNLAAAFDSFQQPVGATNPGTVLPARFHVLITDGVQSTSSQSPDLSCTAGSDQMCVRKKIFDLMNAGWGGCVIALRSEFNGKIYSEVNRAAGRPSVVPYESVGGDPQSRRPFYLYVFSPERESLEPFVATLLERLKPLASEHAESLRVLPLSFRYADAATQAELVAATQGKPKGLVVRQGLRAGIPEFTAEVDLDTSSTGAQPFAVVVTVPWSRTLLGANSPAELVRMLQWELKPVHPPQPNSRERYPEIKFVRVDLDQSQRPVVHLTAQWLPNQVGETCWRGYRLEGRLQPGQQTPDWIREWSTNLDTTRENGNRTLYLESTLLGLWRNSVLNGQLVAEAVIVASAP
jgi:hypothetical protein